jgi:hypothetical protein
MKRNKNRALQLSFHHNPIFGEHEWCLVPMDRNWEADQREKGLYEDMSGETMAGTPPRTRSVPSSRKRGGGGTCFDMTLIICYKCDNTTRLIGVDLLVADFS